MRKSKDALPGSQQQVVLRPADATHDGLRKCLNWLDECRKLGWSDDVMPSLEAMFWQYYDSDGNKKPSNDAPDHRPGEQPKV